MVLAGIAAIALLVVMAKDTKIVRIGSDEDIKDDVFSPERYGAAQFPIVQAAIMQRAVDALTLQAAIEADKKAASEKYGVPASVGAVMSVSFTGVVGEGKSGVYDVKVPGMPEILRIRVQTGPAVNGTELRDATGTISFSQFTNQIEYQDAGSALNNELKAQVLATIDNSDITGKTLYVVGAFKLINVKSWLVTPVSLSLQ